MEKYPKEVIEEAESLIESHKPYVDYVDVSELTGELTSSDKLGTENSIKAALISVEYVIKEYENEICYCGYDNDFEMWNDKKEYKQQVKEYLENKLKEL